MNVHIATTKQDVAQEFSKFLASLIASKSEVHIALSGGSTPKIVFDHLAEAYGETIDWTKVHLYWGDERCVDPTSDESNYKMTVTHLLSKVSIPENQIFRIHGEDDPVGEAIRYSQILEEQLPAPKNIPQFDLVILGMGDDGHTASIFPHEIELWKSNNYCEVAIHPESGQRRISLTGSIINNAAHVAFLVTGASKAPKVKEIFNSTGDYKSYPASLVAPAEGELHWFMDTEAAIGINT